MKAEQIHAHVTDIFRQVFNNPTLELHDGMTAKDVPGWDSLNHIAMISAVEAHFKIKLKLRELLNMENVGDLLSLIKTRTDAAAPPGPK